MKIYIIDIAGWSLVGLAAALGIYAWYLFDAKLSGGLASAIVGTFR
ncbi:hypothetical protein [Paenibacillus silvisoli]|nr:hypothetical protein [Paenibacillus silvisoli]